MQRVLQTLLKTLRKTGRKMENNRLKSISGVLETGLFINVAGRVVIGHSDGKVTINP